MSTKHDLIAFVGARLDEEKELATAASPGPWAANAEHTEVIADDGITVADGFALSSRQLRATVDHIVLHNPDRVLRNVQAKTKTLVRCQEEMLSGIPRLVHFANQTLREMAEPYSNHPDFDKEWRP